MVSDSPELAAQLDWSGQLVGKVRQEFLLPQFFFNAHMPFFSDCVQQYLTGLAEHGSLRTGLEVKVGVRSAWVVRSFANDFNPTHIHSGCQFSSVGYLKLPDWDDELAEDANDHHPCRGQIEFVTGHPQSFTRHQVRYTPRVGDFYIFPAHLLHTVYPFTSPGERRSFSINFTLEQ
ncbi:MAG: putative 2OG-Fe(II) oxygenase [Myxococcota bacterium]|nr:putative 2OG-Fe(II) oxygenase [Myxococcota bacterium]